MMIMTISGQPFIEVPIDFIGKFTTRQRQEHLEDIASILHQEYYSEVSKNGNQANFYYQTESIGNMLEISEFDQKEFEIKLQARRFLKHTKHE